MTNHRFSLRRLAYLIALLTSLPGCGAQERVELSDDVLSAIQRGSKVTAVRSHKEEHGLSLAEAKKQVEDVMERDGLVLGGKE